MKELSDKQVALFVSIIIIGFGVFIGFQIIDYNKTDSSIESVINSTDIVNSTSGLTSEYITNYTLTWSIPSISEQLEYYGCTKYEKLGWITYYGNDTAWSEQGCVSLSNEELLLIKIDELNQRLDELEKAQQNNDKVKSK